MLNKFSFKSANILINKEIIKPMQKDIYIYGFSLFYSTIITGFSILFIGFLFNTFTFGLIFIGYFAFPRFLVGGYHATSYCKCFFISNFIFILEIFIMQLVLKSHFIYTFLIFCNLFSYIYLFLVSIHSCVKNFFYILLSFEFLLCFFMMLSENHLTLSIIAMETTITVTILKILGEWSQKLMNKS